MNRELLRSSFDCEVFDCNRFCNRHTTKLASPRLHQVCSVSTLLSKKRTRFHCSKGNCRPKPSLRVKHMHGSIKSAKAPCSSCEILFQRKTQHARVRSMTSITMLLAQVVQGRANICACLLNLRSVVLPSTGAAIRKLERLFLI